MRYKFVAVYHLLGISPPPDDQEQIIAEYSSTNAKGFIAYNLDKHLFEIDRATAVGNSLLKNLFGQAGEESIEKKLESEINDIQNNRNKNTGKGVFLIFEATGETDSFNPRTERELPDFIIAMDGINKQPIRAQYQHSIRGLLSSFSVSSKNFCGVKKVTDGVIFFNKDNKPVYSISFNMSGKAIVSTSLNTKMLKSIKYFAKVFEDDKNLESVARLLSQSLNEESDELLSFLSIFSAIEIFVNKNFEFYKKCILVDNNKLNKSFMRFLKDAQKDERDKFTLVEKFSIISFDLSPDNVENYFKEFKPIKDVRDDLVHGKDISIPLLPTKDAQKLLRELLSLHIKKIYESTSS